MMAHALSNLNPTTGIYEPGHDHNAQKITSHKYNFILMETSVRVDLQPIIWIEEYLTIANRPD